MGQVAWSAASIAGCPITSLLPASSPSLETYEQKTMTKAYSIIAAKGATAYGVASVVSSICESILFNQCQIRPVSHWVENRQCCVSFPAVLGRGGIMKTFDTPLNDSEELAMKTSVESILECVDLVEKRWSSMAKGE
jgi:L-lactate dehydrogenase